METGEGRDPLATLKRINREIADSQAEEQKKPKPMEFNNSPEPKRKVPITSYYEAQKRKK